MSPGELFCGHRRRVDYQIRGILIHNGVCRARESNNEAAGCIAGVIFTLLVILP